MKTKNLFAAVIAMGVFAPMVAIAGPAENDLQIEYTYSEPSDGALEDEVEIHELKALGMIPLMDRHEDGFGLRIGGAFELNEWDFDDDDRLDDIDLYKIQLPIFGDFDIADDWIGNVFVTPGLHSDLKHIDDDDAKVTGGGAVTYVMSDTLRFMLGAAYYEDFGDAELLPIGGVSWQATEALLVHLVIPEPRIQYTFCEDFRIYAFGEGAGGEWNVGNSGQREQVDIQQEGIRVGGGAEYQILENNWIYVAGGAELEREVQVAVNENEVFDDDLDLSDTAFVKVGFRISR